MSSARIFPPYSQVPPTSLADAVESLSKLQSGSGLPSSKRWDRLLEKIRHGASISDFEKIQLANNCAFIPEELREQFGKIFRNELSVDVLDSSSSSAALLLGPHELITLLTHSEVIAKHGRKHLPNGVFLAGESLGNEAKEKIWLNSKLLERPSLPDLIKLFARLDTTSLSTGQRRLARSLIAAPNLHLVIHKEFGFIIELLGSLKIDGTDPLALVDEMLGHYFVADESWSTKVLDEKFFLAALIGKLSNIAPKNSRLDQHRNIELLRKKILEINNALKMLNDAEPERGNFWKTYISLCQYVEPKRIDAATVATAFVFPTFVIVDYGPTGSAALLYERTTFEEKVRATKRWRDMEFVRPLAPYTNDGRLVHSSGWQRKFNDLIVMLLRNGGRLL